MKHSANIFEHLANFRHKSGPLWARTTDLSLIRNIEPESNAHRIATKNSSQNEQLLKGVAKPTIDSYLGRVKTLLDNYSLPNIFDIKDYLTD